MGVVAVLYDFGSVDMHIVLALQIHLKSHLRWKVKIRVKRARAMARLHGRGRGEFVDVIGTGARPVQAFLDTVAFSSDLGKGQIDLSNDTGDIEPAGVAYAAVILGVEPWADERKALARRVMLMMIMIMIMMITPGGCEGAEGKEVDKDRNSGDHFVRSRRTNG